MMTLAPELLGALDMIAYLRKKGIVTCAAHSDATAEDVHAAADRGLTQITHLFNAQSPLHHRRPGVPARVCGRQNHRAGHADGCTCTRTCCASRRSARGAKGMGA